MSDLPVLRTPLAEVHERLGASFTGFAGWRMPVKYAGHLREHEAVRTAAGLFDLSHMGQIMVTGTEAAAFLDYALVVNASAMPSHKARYTLICTPTGGMIDDLVVYRLGPQEFLVIANAGNVTTVTEHLLERTGTFDVTVRNASEEYALIALQGPRSPEILAPLTPTDLSTLRYYTIATATVAGCDALLARTGYTGELGFEVYVATTDAETVWNAIYEAGTGYGLEPVGLAARDTLRLEASMPLYGNELTVDVTPRQAGLGWAIPADKEADYVGRSALAHLPSEPTDAVLVALTGTGRRAARPGYPVINPADGTTIGQVTSGALSPTLGYPIAMAYVPREFSAPGTAVDVDIRGEALRMSVVERPFYRRPA